HPARAAVVDDPRRRADQMVVGLRGRRRAMPGQQAGEGFPEKFLDQIAGAEQQDAEEQQATQEIGTHDRVVVRPSNGTSGLYALRTPWPVQPRCGRRLDWPSLTRAPPRGRSVAVIVPSGDPAVSPERKLMPRAQISNLLKLMVPFSA